jgi:hypothetical protein
MNKAFTNNSDYGRIISLLGYNNLHNYLTFGNKPELVQVNPHRQIKIKMNLLKWIILNKKYSKINYVIKKYIHLIKKYSEVNLNEIISCIDISGYFNILLYVIDNCCLNKDTISNLYLSNNSNIDWNIDFYQKYGVLCIQIEDNNDYFKNKLSILHYICAYNAFEGLIYFLQNAGILLKPSESRYYYRYHIKNYFGYLNNLLLTYEDDKLVNQHMINSINYFGVLLDISSYLRNQINKPSLSIINIYILIYGMY